MHKFTYLQLYISALSTVMCIHICIYVYIYTMYISDRRSTSTKLRTEGVQYRNESGSVSNMVSHYGSGNANFSLTNMETQKGPKKDYRRFKAGSIWVSMLVEGSVVVGEVGQDQPTCSWLVLTRQLGVLRHDAETQLFNAQDSHQSWDIPQEPTCMNKKM